MDINAFIVFVIVTVIPGAWSAPAGQGPANTVVLEGAEAVLECRFEHATRISWYRGDVWISSGTDIYEPAWPWTHSVLVDEDTNAHDLRITSVSQQGDTGQYLCSFLDTQFGLQNSQKYKYYAKVITLGDDFMCSVGDVDGNRDVLTAGLSVNTELIVTCDLSYGGPWAPAVRCSGSAFRQVSATNVTTTTRVSYTTRLAVIPGVAISQISCLPDFDGTIRIEDDGINDAEDSDYFYARNIPVADPLRWTWTSADIPVSFAPEVTISPSQSSYILGEVITCSAKGNPQPEVTLTSTGGDVFQGTSVEVTSSLVGVTLQCTATNSLGTSSAFVLVTLGDSSNVTTSEPSNVTTTSPVSGVSSSSSSGSQTSNDSGSGGPEVTTTLTSSESPVGPGSTGASVDGNTCAGCWPWWGYLLVVLFSVAVLALIIWTAITLSAKNKDKQRKKKTKGSKYDDNDDDTIMKYEPQSRSRAK